jgi:metal-responsive CopG/Arc/MetJ family transcriptional regulator
MPPDGYITVTLSDDVIEKLTEIMVAHDCDSYAEAIEFAVDETLARESTLTVPELVQMLAERVQ